MNPRRLSDTVVDVASPPPRLVARAEQDRQLHVRNAAVFPPIRS